MRYEVNQKVQKFRCLFSSKGLSASVWSVLKEHQSSPTVINHSFLVAPNDLCSSIISLTVTFMHLASAKNVERSHRLKKTFGFDGEKN